MNIATALKSEISRVARKEVRAEVSALKSASSRYRSDIADLKRRIAQLERLVGQLSKGTRKRVAEASDAQPATVTRYSAKNLAALRKKLGLSAADFGKLLGVSGASVYLWEDGKTRPREKNMPAISRLRGMGKKAALQLLATLK
ncbi:MAG: helix-turn-helix domain-containing protein [Polaromonas sp.]|uniref:helix-turn-helix domain-containing protein n=1 Tax=Polaromonas sp. TaxID=1869339 RepID=UPI0025F85AC5|nr:helix-turn-helix domain-containing protein [Polaromonas sp.]MBI2726340.1 helix-turn-helix domain-containing protein [Polaromonas sp.]